MGITGSSLTKGTAASAVTVGGGAQAPAPSTAPAPELSSIGLAALPYYASVGLLRWLTPQGLVALSQISSMLRRIALHDDIWSSIYKTAVGAGPPEPLLPQFGAFRAWKEWAQATETGTVVHVTPKHFPTQPYIDFSYGRGEMYDLPKLEGKWIDFGGRYTHACTHTHAHNARTHAHDARVHSYKNWQRGGSAANAPSRTTKPARQAATCARPRGPRRRWRRRRRQ